MKYHLPIVAVSMAMFVSGCVQETALRNSFIPSEVSFIKDKGDNTISGQAFLRRNDGIVIYAAGSVVTLIPKSPYTTERINAIYGGSKIAYRKVKFTYDNPELQRWKRTVQANGEGRFVFSEVAKGDYYVTTTVSWKAGSAWQGGSLYAPVSVTSGESKDIVLTSN